VRAPSDQSSATADGSGFAGVPPLSLAANGAAPFSVHEPPDDDTPTVQLLPGQLQAAAMTHTVDLVPGSVLRSRYVLQDIIGRGGSAVIFKAKDLHRASPQDTGDDVLAVKMLRPELRADPSALTRLKREFRQMQCLSHPGIVRVFDIDFDCGAWFISMEFVAGRTVKTWMQTPGSHAEALGIIAACCEAVEYSHSLGILHGDLKATNVLVADTGAVKLIDFGAAPIAGSHLAAASDPTITVTPLYASPQILAGKAAERRDDVYSLACLSYGILSGGLHPFGGHPSLEDYRVKSSPTYVRAIPVELFKVIERGLSAERERRPASAGEFLRDLIDADRRRRRAATSPAIPVRNIPRARRGPGSIAVAADSTLHSTLPTLLKEIRLGAGGLTIASGTAIAPVALDRFVGGRGSDRRATPFMRLTTLVVAIAAAVVLFRIDRHRDVAGTAELPHEASAIFPDLGAVAGGQTEMVAESAPAPGESGVISFETPTLHATAAQSLVAISVKRLQGIRSRGAFVWRVERGTAHPGIDYEWIEPHVVRFIEGQAVRTLFIPLINTGATIPSGDPRTFTVVLEKIAGGPALGRFARITVAIDPPPAANRFAAYQVRAKE
jgi:predicted Ser/Thr protein kinase